jgi:flagellar assembly factor FliW
MSPAAITVHSRRFGSLEVAPEEIIHFPEGLVGLPGHDYVVVVHDPDSPFCWLQSAEDPDLALPVTDPWRFFPTYVVDVPTAEPAENVRVWVTVRAGAKLEDFCANLRAPLLVLEGTGRQVINEAPEAPVRAPLFPPEALAA